MENDPSSPPPSDSKKKESGSRYPTFRLSRGIARFDDGWLAYLPLGVLGPSYAITDGKIWVVWVADYVFLGAMFWCVYALHMVGRPFWWAVGIPLLLFVLMRSWIFPTLLGLPTSKRPTYEEQR